MPVEIIVTPINLTAVLSGEVDHHSAAEIRKAIDAAVLNNTPALLRLDFEQVSFIDSSAVGLVMGRFRLMQELGGRVQVINLTERFYRVMQLAGVEKLGSISLRREKVSTEHAGGVKQK